jgi:uncharacterized Ntn-hydrolase superfamily protein
MTYSIVARDPVTGELGGAVQTRWFAVGAGVLWAEGGVGAVATQSFTEVAHGPNGLGLLRSGRPPAEALASVMAADPGRETRQVGIVGLDGAAAAFTGSSCVEAAGHVTGPDVSCQANMMERDTVWAAMLDAFSSAAGDLAERLMAALRAAEAEGGDVRGRQSAALVVVPGPGATDGARPPAWERRFDLRVDDAAGPLRELERLLRVARGYEAFEAATELAESGAVEAALERTLRALRQPGGWRRRGWCIATRSPQSRGLRSTCGGSLRRGMRTGRSGSWRRSSERRCGSGCAAWTTVRGPPGAPTDGRSGAAAVNAVVQAPDGPPQPRLAAEPPSARPMDRSEPRAGGYAAVGPLDGPTVGYAAGKRPLSDSPGLARTSLVATGEGPADGGPRITDSSAGWNAGGSTGRRNAARAAVATASFAPCNMSCSTGPRNGGRARPHSHSIVAGGFDEMS